MKYIVDLDALKECVALLPKPVTYDGKSCVYLEDVFSMVDAFPKEFEEIEDDECTENE